MGLESFGQQSLETVESSLAYQTGPSVYEVLPEREEELKPVKKVIDSFLDAPIERSVDSFVDRSVERSLELSVEHSMDDGKKQYFFEDCSPLAKEYQVEIGIDQSTQIDDGDLFDFEVVVRAVLESVVPRSLEEALNELSEEKERKELEEKKVCFNSLKIIYKLPH